MAKRVKLRENSLTSTGLPPSGFKYVGYDGFTLSELDSNGNIVPIGAGVNANTPIPINVQSLVSSSTVTPVVGNDLVRILNQSTNLTIANPIGTATEGKFFRIRIKGDGTAHTLAFGNKYRDFCDSFPTVLLTDGKTMYFDVTYNSTDDKWDVLHYHYQIDASGPTSFLIEVKTDNMGVSSNNQFIIPTYNMGYTYSYNVVTSAQTLTNVTGTTTLTWPTPGTYEVEISGNFPIIKFGSSSDKLKITKIKRWGDIVWRSFDYSFFNCSNLDVTATDTPNLNSLSPGFPWLRGMFQGCESLVNANGSIGLWNLGNANNIGSMFANCSNFNVNLNNWDVSNITSMGGLFGECYIYNQPLSNWDVSNVIDMQGTFAWTTAFNQDLSNWDVSSVLYMNNLFYGSGFNNSSIGNWDVSSVQQMGSMFAQTLNFNQSLNLWNTINVQNMGAMFQNAFAFNSDISNWNTSNVVSMQYMFNTALNFNQDLSNWDVSNVTNFTSMFENAFAFNVDLSSWSVSSAVNMSNMFKSANSFNQQISSWDISNVTNMSSMFESAASYDQLLIFNPATWSGTAYGTGGVNMNSMFKNSGMSTENYTDTLSNFASLIDGFYGGGWINNTFANQTNMTFDTSRPGPVGSSFTSASDARDYLLLIASWLISGDNVI
jgi:surface protein